MIFTPHRRSSLAVLLFGCTALTGCVVGPDYHAPPAVDTGRGWTRPVATISAPTDLSHWWRTLGDPELERLVDTALAQNLDIRQAAARIDEARALRDRAAGRQLPTASAGASMNRRRQSENGPLPIGSIPGLDVSQTIYDAGFEASWEVDLFGANRRALESASARLQATQAEAQGVRMRIAAEVARAWFETTGAGEELRAQQAAVATLQQTLELTRSRAALGDVSGADVDAAHERWAAAYALLPGIEARQRAVVLSLGVLLGAPPERELKLLDAPAPHLVLPALPVGERAEILRRRPDVLAAERRLAASTADIGLSPDDWFDGSSTRFSILPLISWRLFDGGRVRAEIRAREAGQRQAALGYEQAVLAALGDAERALSDYDAGLDTVARRQAALEASRRSLGHAEARFAAGDIARIELLAAQRLLHEAETAYARAHAATAVQLVAVYKAIGGGWNLSDAPSSAPVS
ncbi:MAG: RND transporter [Sphingobium sp. 32-64-5]|nr:MAG: RND transporter [Sphingobium sp. 32-64-5]